MSLRLRAALLATLFVVLAALYAPALPHGFNLDDLEQHQYVKHHGPATALGSDSQFRPVKNLYFWSCERLFGDDLRGFRLVALGVFFAHLLVVERYLALLLGSGGGALAATAAYAFLAVHSSVVVWPSAFHILVYAALLLLALILADRAIEGRSAGLGLASLAALAVSLLSYEPAVAFPALAGLQCVFLRRDWRRRGARGYLAALAGLLAAYFVARSLAGARTGADVENLAWPPGERWWLTVSAARYALAHAAYLLDPWTTFGVRVPDLPARHLAASLACWVAFVALLAVAARALWRRRSLAAFGWLFFVAALAPTCNFLAAGSGPVADYYLLLPGIGLVAAAAAAVRGLLHRWQAPVARAVPAALVAALVLGNVWEIRAARLPAWERPLTLLALAHARHGESFFHSFLSARLAQGRGGHREALGLYEAALREAPYHEPSQVGRVVALINCGELDAAWEAVGRLSPRDAEARETLRLCRAFVLEARERIEEAAALYREIASEGSAASVEAKITALIRLTAMNRRWGTPVGLPYSLDRATFDLRPFYLFPGFDPAPDAAGAGRSL